MTVNTQSQKALENVVGHEITHILEGTELYQGLQTAIFDYAKGKGDFDGRRSTLEQMYKDIEGADIDGELTADLVGDYLFTDEAFLKELSGKHRNVFQKIYDEIKHLCKLATAGTKEARQLEKVKKAFDEAYRTTKNTAEDGGVKYSIAEIVDDNGTKYGIGVHLDSDLLAGLTDAERKKMVKLWVVEELAGNSFVAYDNGTPVEISIAQKSDKITADSGRKKQVLSELYRKNINHEVKQEAVVLADELVEASRYDGVEPAHHSHDWLDNNGQNDWDRRTVFVQDKNNAVWTATLQIANSADGRKILYDIDPIKMAEGAGKHAPTTANDSIPNSGEHVNTKNSLSDEGSRQSGGRFDGEDLRWLNVLGREETSVPEPAAVQPEVDLLATDEVRGKTDTGRPGFLGQAGGV